MKTGINNLINCMVIIFHNSKVIKISEYRLHDQVTRNNKINT